MTVGDIVTLFEDNLPRSQWRLERVDTRLMPGADDCARAAYIGQGYRYERETFRDEGTNSKTVSPRSTSHDQ